jgi:hypothetical protein
MGMRKSTRREVRKLREIAHYFLDDIKCCFCRKPLIEINTYAPGRADGSPFDFKLTQHHKNGDHYDQRKSNRCWSHDSCHRAYHLKLRHKEKREAKRLARKEERRLLKKSKLKLVA